MKFNIIVCGGGLGGLGAAIALKRKGHTVTVLEGAPQLAEVGAGIQIPPNCTRILDGYGVYEDIKKCIVWPKKIQFRRYCTGDVIGPTPLHPTMTDNYGYPYWLIHRADYQNCLYLHAKKEGVDVRLNSFVTKVNEADPSVVLGSGEVLKADLIIGADGVRSKTREAVLGAENVEPTDSSNCAYRATVPRDLMLADPVTAHLMSDINANCWIGHQRHIMAYPIRNGAMYNLVMSHPGQAAVGRWNEPGKLDEMRQHYHNFDPTITTVLEKVSACLKWKLADLPPLPRWLSSSGRVVLIGDAAHAMVPYLAQGAATSIEDGAALAECLDYAADVSMIPKVLAAFQEIRKPRCEIIQAGSRANGDIWHMADGPEQEERDRQMHGEGETAPKTNGAVNGIASGAVNGINGTNGTNGAHKVAQNPNRWSDKSFQPWLFGYNTVEETRKFLDEKLGPVA